MADATNLNAGPVILEGFFKFALNRTIVTVFVHVDKVDDNQAGQITQAHLSGNFSGSFQVCLQRCGFDVPLFGGASRIHVNGNKSLGLIDDQITAGLQRHRIGEHGVKLRVHAMLLENRFSFFIRLNIFGMAGHQHAHQVFRLAIGVIAFNQNLVNILGIKIADRTLDQTAFLVNEGGGN